MDTPANAESQPVRANVLQAESADTEQVTRIFLETRQRMGYLPASRYTEEETAAFFRGVIEDPNNTVLKADVDGLVGGFGVFGEGRMDHLYVSPALQNRGIGSQLIQAAQDRFSRLGGWVFEKNTDALKLYERHGFKAVEHTDGSRNEESEPDVRIVWFRS